MGENWAASPFWDARRDPRALVCARALVKAKTTSATEHMTYDLSVGGVRLCGVPRAKLGERMSLLLYLPSRSRFEQRYRLPNIRFTLVSAVSRLVRVSHDRSNPEFALQFEDMDPDGEDAIQDAVLDALDHENRRSLLLVRVRQDPAWRGWDWLSPLSPICVNASTPLEVIRVAEEHDLSVAIMSKKAGPFQLARWQHAIPKLAWRTIDSAGRLRSAHVGSPACAAGA